jgi:hypothetical protein
MIRTLQSDLCAFQLIMDIWVSRIPFESGEQKSLASSKHTKAVLGSDKHPRRQIPWHLHPMARFVVEPPLRRPFR